VPASDGVSAILFLAYGSVGEFIVFDLILEPIVNSRRAPLHLVLGYQELPRLR
jgi:hypothetical protein